MSARKIHALKGFKEPESRVDANAEEPEIKEGYQEGVQRPKPRLFRTGTFQESGRLPVSKRSPRPTVLAVILSVALLLRLAAVWYAPAVPSSDAKDYHDLAVNLLAHHRYENARGALTAWRAPGYPLFLAAIYAATGANPLAVYAVQATIGVMVVLAIFSFTQVLTTNQVGVTAAALAAVYPGFIWPCRSVLSENLAILFMPLTLFTLAGLLKAEQKQSWSVALGLLLGVSTLVRSATIFFAFTLLLMLVFKRLLREAVIVIALSAITLAPSILRNSMVFHRLTGVTTLEGITLYGSYWPPTISGRRIWGTEPFSDPVVVAAMTEPEPVASSRLKQETIHRLIAHPSYFFQLIPEKLFFAAIPLDWEVFPKSRSWNCGYVVVAILAIFGLRKCSSIEFSLVAAAAAAFLLQTVIFYGSPRFRLPYEPVLIVLAAKSLVMGWKTLATKSTQRNLRHYGSHI